MFCRQTVRRCLGDWARNETFWFFGKSSDDDQDTSTEESIPSESSEAADEPQQAPEPQSQAAVDRGATMSDVIKAVTDQFALINADSDADLRAVGAALCQIPEGMSPLSAGFSSFRHEVLHAILMTGEDDGLAARAVVLNKCLTSIEDSPDLAEQGTALRILAEELKRACSLRNRPPILMAMLRRKLTPLRSRRLRRRVLTDPPSPLTQSRQSNYQRSSQSRLWWRLR